MRKKWGSFNKIRKKQTQTKKQKYYQIPSNRRKIVQTKIEKESKVDLQEAKEKLCKKWRHSKGKKEKY